MIAMPHANAEERNRYRRAYERKRSEAPLVADDIIREIYSYDSGTGWIFRDDRMLSGKSCKGGYLQINIFGKMVMAHRLAWFLYYGSWPSKLIDHINGNTSDNRIDNLREASPSDNQTNGRTRRDSTSGIRGVSLRSRDNKWASYLDRNGRRVHSAQHASFLKAVQARRDAVLKHCGEFAPPSELEDALSHLISAGYGAEDISVALRVPLSDVKDRMNAEKISPESGS